MKKIYMGIWITILSACLYAQTAPAIEWQKSLGGSDLDWAFSIQPTRDSGYIVAGGTVSNDGQVSENYGDSDYWIVKLDSDGGIQWEKNYGGSSYEEPRSIQQTADDGYIVVGVSLSNDGDVSGHHGEPNMYADVWVLKLDSNGDIQWQKSLGGSDDDWAGYVQQTTDGGYIVAGWSMSSDGDVSGNYGQQDYWVVKLDNIGGIQWEKNYGGSGLDWADSVQQSTDGGYIVAGRSKSNDGDVSGHHGSLNYYDYWIVKLDSSGLIEWQKSLGGSDDDVAISALQTVDGGYIVAGRSGSEDGDVSGHHGGHLMDYWIVKLDSSGIIEWNKSLGGSSSDYAESIQNTTDGGYIVVGQSGSNDGDVTGNHGGGDYWIVKLDSSGNLQWQKALGGSGEEYARSVHQTADSGYIIAGWTGSNDGDVTEHHGGEFDYWIVKFSTEDLAIQEFKDSKINIYPNPVKDILNFAGIEKVQSVQIFNLEGKLVIDQSADKQELSKVNISSLPEGIYLVKVRTNKATHTVKIIKD